MGEMVPAFLTVLGDEPPAIEPTEFAPHSTGRRAAFARWLTQPDHPLTSRVIVNRIWQQTFGTGLVATPSDFGRLGQPPSHPQLLDWLASEFVAHGWSIKWLQREILLSQAFRQRSIPDAAISDGSDNPAMVDPFNRLLWRFPIRRLGAEQIRDAMLAVSGELDFKAGGPSSGFDSKRRATYLQVYRNRHDDILEVFDRPDRITSAGERNVTTTPTQALVMINSGWTASRARAFARRVEKEVAGADDSRIRQAYRLALARDPSEQELYRGAQFLRDRLDEEEHRSTDGVTLRTMPLTASAAAVISDNRGMPPLEVVDSEESLPDDFSVEAVVVLNSLYPDATVRTIVSKWDSDTGHPGWALGVTSTKSRYNPRHLILQLVGNGPDGNVHYEVIPSRIHLELDRPYYVACRVRLSETGREGVTFHVRDLMEPESKLTAMGIPHLVTSGVANDAPVILGGRQKSARHVWDGLIDEVRISREVIDKDQLLPIARRYAPPPRDVSAENVVGHWSFDDETSRGRDFAGAERDLLPIGESSARDSAPFVDFCHVLLNSNEFLYVD